LIFSDSNEDNKLNGKAQENLQYENSPPEEGWRKFFGIFDGVVFNSILLLAPIAAFV
jgi:hypothetical protein